MKEIEEKIRDIGNFLCCNEEELVSEMLPLIKQEREDAVRGFIEYLKEFTTEQFDSGSVVTFTEELLDGLAKTYLRMTKDPQAIHSEKDVREDEQ